MSQLQNFLNILENQVKNHSIYVWGAQGQKFPILCESWIKSKESGTHETNALKMWQKAVAAGCKDTARAFDCSGLGVWALQQLGIIKTDMNANGMKGKCTLISKSALKRGDWVFKVNSIGRAYHIGYVVDDALNVVEAQGRAYGVVKRPLSKGGWNKYGRPCYFADEIDTIEEQVEHASFNRLLKKGMKGDDVRELQKLLNTAGDDIKVDGDFGSKTLAAVKAFQKRVGLKVDGVVGEKTIAALIKIQNTAKSNVWSVSRLLKKGCNGDDVKMLQKALINAGYSCGSTGADGDFGTNTEKAVKAFQKVKGLTVDGIVGKKTVIALGGTWK